MTWDEFLNENVESALNGQEKTDILCPKCGRRIYLDKTVVLTSYPAKYIYWCSCGWRNSAPKMWRKEKPND